jgi:hypothetical protein
VGVPFTGVVSENLRRTAQMSLLGASVVGMLACPQLLPNDFKAGLAGTGGDGCALVQSCVSGSSLASSGGGGAGGHAGTGGSASVGGSGTAGGGSASGNGGTGDPPLGGHSGDGDAGAPADGGNEPPVTEPDCRVVALTSRNHRAADNCVGVYGWNEIVTDPSTASTVSQGYRDSNVCFVGTIVPSGWGAVYNLTFANENAWNATSFDVDGFELAALGPGLPPKLEVIIEADDQAEFCRTVTPAASVLIPFDSAREDCDAPKPGTLDPTALFVLRLHFPIATTEYDLDFCLRIRALP